MKTFPMIAIVSLAAAFAAQAEAESPQASDTGVRALCPAVETELEDHLGALVQRYGEAGRAEVSFEVVGQTVRAVQTHGGPPAYRQAVRRAIGELACSNDDAGVKTVRLELLFKPMQGD